MSTPRENIHVSLGSSANAITAHLLNLEGLAATDSASSCNPNITHTISNDTYVPRVLIVDQAKCFSFSHPHHHSQDQTVATWSGRTEVHEQEQQEDRSNVLSLQEAASALAYSSYSRYHVSPNQASYASASNGRHVQWDSDEEEEEEDPEERQRRQERAKHKWQLSTQQPLQEKLDSFWTDASRSNDSLSWMEYWMPPHPPHHNYAVPLPFSNDSNMAEHWDTYQMGASLKTAEDLLEKLRRTLETCDSVQGVTILSEGYGIYAGMTTALLQDLEEECRTAGRLVINVVDDGSVPVDKENEVEEESWQAAHTERVRRQLQSGLALHDMTTHAHAVLPLAMSKETSLFSSSARVALALETATLAYRLSGSNQQSRIGLNGGYFGGVGPSDEGYGVASHLSFGEYLACMQPSSQYPMLELDIMNHNTATSWNEALLQGTRLERERMLQQGGRDANVRRPRDVLPGAWLNSHKDGLLTGLSPEMGGMDRSVHHQFALTTSLRPSSARVSSFTTTQYLTFLMEGMAFRYRPEVSMGTVLSESVSSLTSGGYGAGSYWKSLFPEGDIMPVLSVVSNSTRSYGYLNSVASDMKQVLAPRFKGYLNRDTAEGILPDAEDCTEAMEQCFDVRDLYAPPEGSGLVVNSEGTYFDVDE